MFLYSFPTQAQAATNVPVPANASAPANHQPLNFPAGDNTMGEQGVIELKLAWKELDPQKVAFFD